MTGPSLLPSLTYLEFHLLFVIPPVLFLLATTLPLDRPRAGPTAIGLLIVLAVVYTTPWDNHLIEVGVWSYGEGTVLWHIWHAPIEEYLFFVLQPLLTSLWLARLDTESDYPLGIPLGQRALGALGGGLVATLGWLFLAEPTYYLGTLLLWAAPVLTIQWAFGWPVLIERGRTVLLGIGVPTVYLCAIDRIAIGMGIWTFDEAYMTGVAPLGLPLEEILFFTLTNVFVVQGLVLFWWVTDRWPQVRGMWNRTTAG